MRAYVMMREQPWYRREAFCEGLGRAGHKVFVHAPDRRLDEQTLLVIWNRYNTWHEIAKQVEARGGKVLVAENGYVARGGGTPKFDVFTQAGGQREHYYAIAEGWHNGGGRWPHGGSERWEALDIELKPWRQDGEYVLVCPNRSFGVGERVMHPDWADRTAAKLRKAGHLVRIRQHPGNNEPKRPLAEDLAGAMSVYVWSSSCGVHALIAGIPVICEAPYWICKDWQVKGREETLQRMAWAQWTVEEIASGEPFRRLLPAA